LLAAFLHLHPRVDAVARRAAPPCRKLPRDGLPIARPALREQPGLKETAMKRRVSGAALLAFGLATITGCSVQIEGDDSIAQQFGSDYVGAGGMVNVTEPIEGDAFLAGGRVAIATEVQGDLVVAGGEVSLGGAVGDDLYAAGGNVQLDSIVTGNVRLAGGDVTVGPATVVAGAVNLTGGRVQFDGNTHRNLHASGGSIRINGEVHGDAVVRAEELVVGPDTRIGGRLVFRGPTEPEIAEGAVIVGGVEFQRKSARRVFDDTSGRTRDAVLGVGSVLSFIGLFLTAALFLALFPKFAASAAAVVGRKPLQSLGLGLAFVACVPFLGVVLLITVIGIPLALLLVPIYLLLLFLGWTTVALFVAQRGLDALRPGRPSTMTVRLLALFLALVALWLLRQVPLVGGLLAFVALLAGIGAFVWQAWNRREATPQAAA
jgi:hypothetical protein